MKKILLVILLVLIGFVSNAQIQKPDTLQLSPKELFGESDDWNDVGILQSYVNFSKDVLSSSNLSVGIIGKQISSQKLQNNKLDVSGLKTGMYLLKISQKEKTTTKKLVVK